MKESVLNPRLYLRLVRAFGHVEVHRRGEPMQVRPVGKSFFNRKAKLDVLDWGEAYRINCFYCGDSRQRLYINHRWDPDNFTYNKFVKCYNEECQQCPDFRAMLTEKLDSAPLANVPIMPAAQAKAAPITGVQWPGECIPVHKLAGSHPAVQYLAGRGFDVYELGTEWDISWCNYSTVLPRQNRLFVPFYDLNDKGEKVLVGGQARWLDPVTGNASPPKDSKKDVKWFTLKGTRPSQTLFNGWRVREDPSMVVIVEGPFDAMRLGPGLAVAVFGHAISYTHCEILWKYWGVKGGVCVIWMDPDTDDEAALARREEMMREQWRDRLIRIKTGGTRDIGDMSRQEAHAILQEAIIGSQSKS